MKTPAADAKLPLLPCACANLRRAARAVTRLYDEELRYTALEPTQFTLLMALDLAGEVTQGHLGRILALDSTTLTRTLRLLLARGWVRAAAGSDRRERYLSLTPQGRRKFRRAQPAWERAQQRLEGALGPAQWKSLAATLEEVARAAG